MILNLLFFINFFEIFILINANEQLHFGIINHHTQWYFHCPENITKMFDPPSNYQPLISYECPNPSLSIEILPVEIDFTFLCHLQSRLIWFIIDLYQYNTNFWLINSKSIEIKIELNNKIQLNNSKIEVKNYTNRFIIINAFYIPFESIDILLNQEIEINIQIKNFNQLNQCQFYIKDNYLWKTFIDNDCDSEQPHTFFIQYAKCDFYSNKFILSDDSRIKDTITTSPSEISYYHHFLLLEENDRQILAALSRLTKNSLLLKLTFIFLVIILILLIVFFLYMLCYHYHIRMRSSSLIKKSSALI
jgi:hypothetical protein